MTTEEIRQAIRENRIDIKLAKYYLSLAKRKRKILEEELRNNCPHENVCPHMSAETISSGFHTIHFLPEGRCKDCGLDPVKVKDHGIGINIKRDESQEGSE